MSSSTASQHPASPTSNRHAQGGSRKALPLPQPSPPLPSHPVSHPPCREHGVYLLLFLQFNGFLGGLLFLHPQLLVPMLQQIKEGGGRPVGKKSDRSEVWEEPENPLSPEAACLTTRAAGTSALPKAGFLQPWKKRVPFVSHSTNVFFFFFSTNVYCLPIKCWA